MVSCKWTLKANNASNKSKSRHLKYQLIQLDCKNNTVKLPYKNVADDLEFDQI
jgi:hypothetical protein